jgi:two-component system sensor histidine kinase DesK
MKKVGRMRDSGGKTPKKYPFLPADPDIGWLPYAWLAYLIWFLWYPAANNSPAHVWAISISAIVIFLPLYFAGYWVQGPRALWISGGMAAVGVGALPFNPTATMFFMYAAADGAFTTPVRRALQFIIALVGVLALESWILRLNVYVWGPGIMFTCLIAGVCFHQAQRRRMNRRLAAAQREIERLAKIAERERIARDLHDVVGHTLSLVVLKSELASRIAVTDPSRALREIQDVERVSRDALAQVRAAVRGYRASGLSAEIDHMRETLEFAGIHLECDMDPARLTAVQESALAMAIREAVTNVVRHSGARNCRIELRTLDDGCLLVVADDGRGGPIEEGCGLAGMRERIQAAGGSLTYDGSAGLRLELRMPSERREATGAA